MFEDECQRASLRRRGVIARGVAKRCLVAFLAFAMAFGTTPAQLWAEGSEGHYRRCGSGYDARRGRSACGRYR